MHERFEDLEHARQVQLQQEARQQHEARMGINQQINNYSMDEMEMGEDEDEDEMEMDYDHHSYNPLRNKQM
jgi:hypothetical protein